MIMNFYLYYKHILYIAIATYMHIIIVIATSHVCLYMCACVSVVKLYVLVVPDGQWLCWLK